MEDPQGDPSVCVILERFLGAVLLDEISKQGDHRDMEDQDVKRAQSLISCVRDELWLQASYQVEGEVP